MIKVPYLNSIEDFEAVLSDKSDARDLIVFKVSPICNMSFMAEEQMDRWLAEERDLDVYKVDVIGDRRVSQHIERHFDILHESPQVLWIGPGKEIRWHGSHRGVSETNLTAVMNGESPPPR